MKSNDDLEEDRDVEVSIIMAAYNAADYILLSVQSVRNQTERNWELLICDDHSYDELGKLFLP